MRKTFLLGAALVVALFPAAQAFGGRAPQTVTVAMHDPGCHWFLTGTVTKTATTRTYSKSLIVKGPIRLLNIDEAALKVVGPHGLKLARVGKLLPLGAGVYHITMVGQAPDDNHLLLRVK